jgi:hypothetical protein
MGEIITNQPPTLSVFPSGWNYQSIGRRVQVCGRHGGALTLTNGVYRSNGTQTSATYRWKVVALVDAVNPMAHFANLRSDNAGGSMEVDGDHSITVRCSLEKDGEGTRVAGLSDGKPSASLAAGALDVPFEFPIHLVKGQTYWLRVHVSVASAGQFWPLGRVGWATLGEGATANADQTLSGDPGSGDFWGFGPVAFTGIPTNENPVVWLFNGDSILKGYSASNPNGLPNHGVLAQAAEELGQPWMINSIVGYGLYSDAPENIDYGSPGSVPNMRLRARLARYATHYLQCVGTNDINNGQPVDTLRWRMAQHSRWARGLGLIPCQTTLSVWTAWNAAKKADLVTINTLIRNRTNVGPLTGVIDFADAWETARNSGVIRSGYSSDGVHPEPGAGFDALKTAMKTALATVPRTV